MPFTSQQYIIFDNIREFNTIVTSYYLRFDFLLLIKKKNSNYVTF